MGVHQNMARQTNYNRLDTSKKYHRWVDVVGVGQPADNSKTALLETAGQKHMRASANNQVHDLVIFLWTVASMDGLLW